MQQKNKLYQKVVLILSITLMSSLSVLSLNFIPVNAQNVGASLTLNQGSLSLDTSQASCNLSATVSSNSQVATCTISPIVITDSRGSGTGWSATYTVRNFSSQDSVIPLCGDLACGTKNLSVTWTGASASAGSLFGINDTMALQQPSTISGLSPNDSSNSLSLISFGNASQTYAQAIIKASGSGYTSAPSVVFTGGNCTQNPVATASVSTGKVTGITFTTPGLNCTSVPVISLTGGNGSGAQATSISGAGEGKYTKSTATNGFMLTIPAYIRQGNYSSVISFSVS